MGNQLTPHIAGARANAGGTLSEYDTTFAKVIGRHFDMDSIAHDGADTEFPHLPRRVSDNTVTIFQDDAKAAVRINFIDHTFERKQLFLRQKLSQLPKD
jgi:hypothetical protein